MFLHDKFTLSFPHELGNITKLKRSLGGRITPESFHLFPVAKETTSFVHGQNSRFLWILPFKLYFLKQTYRYIIHFLKCTLIYNVSTIWWRSFIQLKVIRTLTDSNVGDEQLLFVILYFIKSTVLSNPQKNL